MADKAYKPEGYQKRKATYDGIIVAGAALIALAITLGWVTLEQIESFIELAIYLVGVLAGLGMITASALARNNVEPPELHGKRSNQV